MVVTVDGVGYVVARTQNAYIHVPLANGSTMTAVNSARVWLLVQDPVLLFIRVSTDSLVLERNMRCRALQHQ